MRAARGLVAVLLTAVVLPALASCRPDASAPARGGADGVIALLLPESTTARYEAKDRPSFEGEVRRGCPTCKVLYFNAQQDPARQRDQADEALREGASVLVIDAVDGRSATQVVTDAAKLGVPVVAYDRLIPDGGIATYVSFKNEEIGAEQASALVTAVKHGPNPHGAVVMLNGSPTDHNAGQYKDGAHTVFDVSGLAIAREYDTPDWSPDVGQNEMEQAIAQLGADRIAGVYAANDSLAGAVITALRAAHVRRLPPVTGQDAELAAVRRILAGQQYMTVYKPIRLEAEHAARVAIELSHHRPLAGSLAGPLVDDSGVRVHAVLFDPVPVTRATVRTTVVADGFYTAAELCTPRLRQACTAAGVR